MSGDQNHEEREKGKGKRGNGVLDVIDDVGTIPPFPFPFSLFPLL
jgi:hypothetical protein